MTHAATPPLVRPVAFAKCRCGRKLAKLAPHHALSSEPPPDVVPLVELACPKCHVKNYVYPTSRAS